MCGFHCARRRPADLINIAALVHIFFVMIALSFARSHHLYAGRTGVATTREMHFAAAAHVHFDQCAVCSWKVQNHITIVHYNNFACVQCCLMPVLKAHQRGVYTFSKKYFLLNHISRVARISTYLSSIYLYLAFIYVLCVVAAFIYSIYINTKQNVHN